MPTRLSPQQPQPQTHGSLSLWRCFLANSLAPFSQGKTGPRLEVAANRSQGGRQSLGWVARLGLSVAVLGGVVAPAVGQEGSRLGSIAPGLTDLTVTTPAVTAPALIAQSRVTPAEQQRFTEPGDRNPEFLLNPDDPLNPVTTDPLFPAILQSRPFSPLERQAFQTQLEALDTQAQAAYEEGESLTAFTLWFRLLRLQPFLEDPLEEVTTLGRVGELAWEQGQSAWVVTITDRLVALETELLAPGPSAIDPNLRTNPDLTADPSLDRNPSLDPDRSLLQLAFARSYGQVRALPQAIALTQQLLSTARDRQDLTAQVLTLAQLSQLQAGSLDYIAAAQTTAELLDLVQANPSLDLRPLRLWRTPRPRTGPAATAPPPRLNRAKVRLQEEQRLWEDRAVFWDLAQDWSIALEAQRDLAVFYSRAAVTEPDLALKAPESLVKQAQYQALLGDRDGAIATYRQAYSQAQTLKLYEVAREILQDLISLYRVEENLDQVLALYRTLLKTHQVADDAYGMVATYQELGLFYRDYASADAALEVLRRALGIAERIDFRVEEIKTQIEVIETPLEEQLLAARSQVETGDIAGAIAAYDHIYELAQFFQRRDLQQQVLWDRLTLYQDAIQQDPAIVGLILQTINREESSTPEAPPTSEDRPTLADLTLATYGQLLTLYQQEQDRPGLLETYRQLGNFYLQNPDLEQSRSLARSNFQQALALVEQLLYFSPNPPEDPLALAEQLQGFRDQIRAIDRSLKQEPELTEQEKQEALETTAQAQ
ncbi:MAG: hypothetical protein ACO331_11970 [Prochlorothrix sp.]